MLFQKEFHSGGINLQNFLGTLFTIVRRVHLLVWAGRLYLAHRSPKVHLTQNLPAGARSKPADVDKGYCAAEAKLRGPFISGLSTDLSLSPFARNRHQGD